MPHFTSTHFLQGDVFFLQRDAFLRRDAFFYEGTVSYSDAFLYTHKRATQVRAHFSIYRVEDKQEKMDTALDIDYLEIKAMPKIISWLSKLEFSVGNYQRFHNGMLLVAYNPGYLYVEARFKAAICGAISDHFGVYLNPSDNDYVLFQSANRRLGSLDLQQI